MIISIHKIHILIEKNHARALRHKENVLKFRQKLAFFFNFHDNKFHKQYLFNLELIVSQNDYLIAIYWNWDDAMFFFFAYGFKRKQL